MPELREIQTQGVTAVKFIKVRSGDFYAELYLDRLGELPRSNFRKLLRLMRGAPWENQEALDTLGAYLKEQVNATKAGWTKASLEYSNGWKLVKNKRSRKKEVMDTLRENRRLKNALKRAKGAHDTAIALQTIFDKEIN